MTALDGYITEIIQLKYYEDQRFYTLRVRYTCHGRKGETELLSCDKKKLEKYKVGDRITI